MRKLFKRKRPQQIQEPKKTRRELSRERRQKKRFEILEKINRPEPIKLNSTIRTNKIENMKILKPAGKIALSVLKGFADALFPNITNTIKMKDSDFQNEPGKKWEIDFPRLLAAVTVWIILLLVFFGKVKFEDVVEIIGRLL